jgi:hypothetical protein
VRRNDSSSRRLRPGIKVAYLPSKEPKSSYSKDSIKKIILEELHAKKLKNYISNLSVNGIELKMKELLKNSIELLQGKYTITSNESENLWNWKS